MHEKLAQLSNYEISFKKSAQTTDITSFRINELKEFEKRKNLKDFLEKTKQEKSLRFVAEPNCPHSETT